MEDAISSLLVELEKIPLVDPHSHIDPHAPTARSLGDLLGYHYYTELAHSVGMPKAELTADPRLLAENIANYLPAFSNTVQHAWLMDIANRLLGFKHRELNVSNIGELFDCTARRTAEPDWTQQVFAHANLEAIFLTNDFDDPLSGFDVARYVPCLRTDELAFKLDDPRVRARFAKATGFEPDCRAGLESGVDRLFEHFVRGNARACAISLPPDFAPDRPADHLVDARIQELQSCEAGQFSREKMLDVAHWFVHVLAERCVQHHLPFDLMIGVHRNVYPAGVFQGTDLFDQRTSLFSFRGLFNAHPACVFPVSVLTHGQNQELAAYSWIFPNVIVSGHWWYSNLPTLIEMDLRVRLEAVPSTKLIGYYSDAYKLEFVAPKFRMYRESLARVLIRDFVVPRRWTEEKALNVGRRLLRGNVLEIFGSIGSKTTPEVRA